ncbi:MAG: extracellular solute-binding protein [Patescibacteria group bacterium]
MDKKYWILGGAVLVLIILGTLLLLSNRGTPEASELTLLTYNEDEKNLTDYITAFEAKNNVKINFVKVDPQNYELESLNRLSTSKVDIWGIPNSWMPKQHDKLTPAGVKLSNDNVDNSTYYNSLYPKIVLQENIINNNIYGLPVSLDTLVLFVNNNVRPQNQDLTLEEEEVLSTEVKNWDELVTKSQLLTEKSGSNISQSGVALGTEDVTNASDILTVLMMQYGTQMTNKEKTQATFHTALNVFGGSNYPGAAALDFYTSFGKSNNPNYSFSKNLGDPLQAFSDNKIAYYIDYSAKESDILRLNPDISYAIKALPQIKATKNPVNFASYETFTVPNSSKNQTLAWQFLAGLTQKNNLKTYLETSKNHPALTELQDTSEIVDQSIQTAQSWYNPEPTQVTKIFQDAISQVVTGQKAQTVLDGAAVQVTSLLGKIGN